MPTQAERFAEEHAKLRPADEARVDNHAYWHSWGSGLAKEDLKQEAVKLICSKERFWPPYLTLVPFWMEVIRSVASNGRKKRMHSVLDGGFAHRTGGGRAGAVVVRIEEFAANEPAPEENIWKHQIQAQLLSYFAGRPNELAVLNRIFGDGPREELQGEMSDRVFLRASRNIKRAVTRLRDQWT